MKISDGLFCADSTIHEYVLFERKEYVWDL